MNDIYPGPLNACIQGEKIICLPWGMDLYALYWNKDLFEAAGLDPEKPPATMEELVEYADKLTKISPDGEIEQIGFIPDQPWDHTELYVRMFGGFWYSEDGTQLLINKQPMIDAVSWQQQFYSKYGYKEVVKFASGFGEYNSPDHPFFAGKLAMYVDGEWITGPNYIPTFKPELNYGVHRSRHKRRLRSSLDDKRTCSAHACKIRGLANFGSNAPSTAITHRIASRVRKLLMDR